MALRRVRCVVEGRVQGVFFRACTYDEACRLALSGWVFNRTNGGVEAEFQGEDVEIGMMINWLQTGSPMSQVNKVSVTDLELIEGTSNFQIKY